jgi:hypothetical protein
MTRNNPHSTSVDTSVEMYLTHHRRNLKSPSKKSGLMTSGLVA